jgi:hypothetical protein
MAENRAGVPINPAVYISLTQRVQKTQRQLRRGAAIREEAYATR